MAGNKGLIAIWVAVLVSGLSCAWYINHVLDMVAYSSDVWMQNEPLDVDLAVKSGGLVFEGQNKPVTIVRGSNITEPSDIQPAVGYRFLTTGNLKERN